MSGNALDQTGFHMVLKGKNVSGGENESLQNDLSRIALAVFYTNEIGFSNSNSKYLRKIWNVIFSIYEEFQIQWDYTKRSNSDSLALADS